MVGAKTGISTHMNQIESHAHLRHYHGHTLQLVVGETIKPLKIMRGTLEAVSELNKLQIHPKNARTFQ